VSPGNAAIDKLFEAYMSECDVCHGKRFLTCWGTSWTPCEYCVWVPEHDASFLGKLLFRSVPKCNRWEISTGIGNSLEGTEFHGRCWSRYISYRRMDQKKCLENEFKLYRDRDGRLLSWTCPDCRHRPDGYDCQCLEKIDWFWPEDKKPERVEDPHGMFWR
jgi:hypothetical protein